MDLKNVYKIEKFSQDELDNVNLLIEHGWTLLQVGTSDFYYDKLGHNSGSVTLFFLAADKQTFKEFNLEKFEREQSIKTAAQSLSNRLKYQKELEEEKLYLNKLDTNNHKNCSDGPFGDSIMEISDDDLPF